MNGGTFFVVGTYSTINDFCFAYQQDDSCVADARRAPKQHSSDMQMNKSWFARTDP
jgi:hypothetical protein